MNDDWLNKQTVTSILIDKYAHRPIWMYDQEPLFPSAIDPARWAASALTNKKYEEIINRAPFSQILGMMGIYGIRTINVPIWCHSEIYSPEIDSLANNLFVPCYYWYHAFVARDWFRHWRYSKSLMVGDKSDREHRFLLYARDFSGTRGYRKTLVENLEIHQDQIQYHWNSEATVGAEASAYINLDDANTAGIHLVAETLFDTPKIHLTEKIFKPMVMSQPFIVWGPPGTLEYLRSYGFRTFDGIWSEDYDLETDHDRRMFMLTELVDKISRLDQDQYREMYRRCLPIVAHNRDRFFSDTFMDFCWSELTINFEKAIALRNDLYKNNPGGQVCYVLGNNPELFRVDIFRNLLEKIVANLPDHDRRILAGRYQHFNDL